MDLVAFVLFYTGLFPIFPAKCPDGMALVGFSCVDLYEAPNIRGERPFVMQRAVDGEAWCSLHQKRLCTFNEWVAACEGTYKQPPVVIGGRIRGDSPCNNKKDWKWVSENLLNSPVQAIREKEALRVWQGEPSGSRESCVSSRGVYDTIGNVEEWVKSPRDPYGYALMGHYWSRPAESCTHRVTNHAAQMYYYETGFRCCSNATWEWGEVTTSP